MKKTTVFVAFLMAFSAAAWSQDGGATFKAKCVMCHGADGMGKPNMGAKLVGTTKSEADIVALLTKGGAPKGIHVKPMSSIDAPTAKALATFVKGLK